MVVITVDNSYSKITGLASGPFNKLRKTLSYSIDAKAAYFSNNRFNTVRYCIDKQGNFPSGLLDRVYRFLAEEKLGHTSTDRRIKPISKPGMFKLRLEE